MSHVHPLHPDNKTEYQEGDRVEFMLDGAEPIRTGTIRGISTRHLIDQWIVELDEKIEGWQYSSIIVQHTFMRRIGGNDEFICRMGFPKNSLTNS